MSSPYYAERSRLFLWLSCVMQSDFHPTFPSVNWHWWHSGQQSHDTNFQLPLDYDSSFFPPSLNPPSSPGTQNSSNVANSFCRPPAGPQVFTHHPSGSAPFFVMLPDGPAFLLWMGCGDSSVLFFLVLLLRGPFHKTPTESSALLRKSVAFCKRSQLCSVSCFPKPIWSAVEPRCQQPLRQVKYFEVVLRLRGPCCGWNYGRVVGQWSGVQGASLGRDADNYIQRQVGCFHCHALSLMETKCSPRWSLNLSCWVMCLGQMVIGLIFPHTVVFFPPLQYLATTEAKMVQSFWISCKGSLFLNTSSLWGGWCCRPEQDRAGLVSWTGSYVAPNLLSVVGLNN